MALTLTRHSVDSSLPPSPASISSFHPSLSRSSRILLSPSPSVASHSSMADLAPFDAHNVLPPRSRAALVRQSHKLQRLLGETPHFELASALVATPSAQPAEPIFTALPARPPAARRNTLTSFPFSLPSPPLASYTFPAPPSPLRERPPNLPSPPAQAHCHVASKAFLPTLTVTQIPHIASPPCSVPPSPSSIAFSGIEHGSFMDADEDEDVLALQREVQTDLEAERREERRKSRARLAKLTRWTGENVPAALVLGLNPPSSFSFPDRTPSPARKSVSKDRGTRDAGHGRSKSVLVEPKPERDTADLLERGKAQWDGKARRGKIAHAHAPSAPSFPTSPIDVVDVSVPAAPRPPCPIHGPHPSQGREASLSISSVSTSGPSHPFEEPELRRSVKLSKFFGVSPAELPLAPPVPPTPATSPPPQQLQMQQVHKRCPTSPELPARTFPLVPERTRSISASSQSHTPHRSSSSQPRARPNTPFSATDTSHSEEAYDAFSEEDDGTGVRVHFNAKRTRVAGRLSGLDKQELDVVMDKLRRLK